MRNRVIALGLLAAVSTGCTTTLSDLRATPPVREASIVTTRPRVEVAACTMDGLETGREGNWVSYRLLNRTPDQTSVLGSTTPVALGSGGPLLEAMFTSNGSGVVMVSTRVDERLSSWRIRRIERDDFWPLVEKCAAVQPALAR